MCLRYIDIFYYYMYIHIIHLHVFNGTYSNLTTAASTFRIMNVRFCHINVWNNWIPYLQKRCVKADAFFKNMNKIYFVTFQRIWFVLLFNFHFSYRELYKL